MKALPKSWLVSVLALAMSGGLAACGSGGSNGINESISGGQESAPTIRFESLSNSSSEVLLAYAKDEGLFDEHGIRVDVTNAPSLATLYQDFVAGHTDCVFGDPVQSAAQAAEGLPVHLVSSALPGFAYVLAEKGSGIKSPRDLIGKRLVGTTAGGAYKLQEAEAQLWFDTSFPDDVEIVQSQTGSDGIAQLASGSADAAFLFETGVTQALKEHPNLEIAFDMNKEFTSRTGGRQYWISGLLCRTDKDLSQETLTDFVELLSSAGRGLTQNPAAADALAVEMLGADAGIYKEAIDSGRMKFDFETGDDDLRRDVEAAMELQVEAGLMESANIPDAFYE